MADAVFVPRSPLYELFFCAILELQPACNYMHALTTFFMRLLATLLFAQQLSVQDFSQRSRRFTSQHSFDSMAANMTASQQLDADLLTFLSTVEDRSPEWQQSALNILAHMEVVTHE